MRKRKGCHYPDRDPDFFITCEDCPYTEDDFRCSHAINILKRKKIWRIPATKDKECE